jgi:hypothetical protein
MAWAVGPANDTYLSEMVTMVRIDDEGAGEFLVIEQHARTDLGKIAIDVAEWPALKATIDEAIKLCRS